jgi:hypothetical protein
MFHGLTKVKLGRPIWDDTSLTLVRQWLKNIPIGWNSSDE